MTTGNFFEEVLDDVKGVERRILGPDYEYWKQINSPGKMGMSTKGSLSAIASNVGGLINYVDLLITGKGSASATGGPLGNKFFLKTAATCKDIKSKKHVDRYIYVNNVPDGSIPFISSGMNMNFSEFEGLVPGTLSNVSALNPMLIFQAFMSGSEPECQEITLETIDVNNNKSTETRHVTTVDIKNMNSCDFKPVYDRNPVTGEVCREAFTNRGSTKMPDDFLSKLLHLSLSILGIYLLLGIIRRVHERK